MKNFVIDFESQSVEFKFMVTNRDVVTNSNLRQEIQKYGIAQTLSSCRLVSMTAN